MSQQADQCRACGRSTLLPADLVCTGYPEAASGGDGPIPGCARLRDEHFYSPGEAVEDPIDYAF